MDISTINDLLQFVEEKTYPKGHILLLEGAVCQHIYVVKTGGCRLFYYRDEKDITAWFAFEGDTITSTSFFSRQPSTENIQALSDLTVYQLHYDRLQTLFNTYPQAERFARLQQERIIMQLEARLKGLQCLTAKARYDHLLTFFPTLMLRVPHHLVASYLGITPETLSRIRAVR